MNELQKRLNESFANLLRRRWFLKECSVGLGSLAAMELLAGDLAAEGQAGPLAPKEPHFPPKVKRVIYMFQAGAPSQLELYDPKPELAKRNG
ncbi:MAG: sulfatase, partial [Pirellula sp.]